MNDLDWPETKEPSAFAIKAGRAVFGLIGAMLLGIPLAYSYINPGSHIGLASLCMTLGMIFIWLSITLPAKAVAHFGFWISWFLPHE